MDSLKPVTVLGLIPAYNEAETIGEVVQRASEYVDRVVVVDDGSTDGTAQVARDAGAHVVRHAVNMGVGAAQRTGYRYAIKENFDYIVQIDADGQHDPEFIPELLEAAKGSDMVIGSRYLNKSYKDYPLVRRTGIKFFTFLVNKVGGAQVTDVTSGFRVYRVEALKEILHNSNRHWAVEQTLEASRRGQEIREISVEMPVRETGESQFDLAALLFYPLRMLDIVARIVVFR